MSAKTCLTVSALSGFLAVFLGAFGAHRLGDSGFLERKYADMDAKSIAGMELPAAYKYLQDFNTGVRYHMWHSLALMGIGLAMLKTRSKLLSAAAWCFLAGIVLFSGSLYVLVICGPSFGGIKWGLVAPIGGTLQLVGWLLMATAFARLKPEVSHATDDRQ